MFTERIWIPFARYHIRPHNLGCVYNGWITFRHCLLYRRGVVSSRNIIAKHKTSHSTPLVDVLFTATRDLQTPFVLSSA